MKEKQVLETEQSTMGWNIFRKKLKYFDCQKEFDEDESKVVLARLRELTPGLLLLLLQPRGQLSCNLARTNLDESA